MDDAKAVLAKYIKAQEDLDIEALVSCWHPDVEAVHPMRPDRNWSGRDTYEKGWRRQWSGSRKGRNTVILGETIGNRIYMEGVTEHDDGTLMPNMCIMEVEDGMIRRVRVYTDVIKRDGEGILDLVNSMNPDPEA